MFSHGKVVISDNYFFFLGMTRSQSMTSIIQDI